MKNTSEILIKLLYTVSEINNVELLIEKTISGFLDYFPDSGVYFNNSKDKIDFRNINFYNNYKEVIDYTLNIIKSYIQKINLADVHKQIVENTSDMLWELDINSFFTYVSPRSFDILGYKPSELVGKNAFDLMSTEEKSRVEKIYLPLLNNKEPFFGLENVNIHKDGHEVIIESSGIPLLNKDGELIGYSGIDRDITKRKQTEDALKESELTFRALFEKGPIGVAYHKMIYNSKGLPTNYLFLDANNSYKELTGVDPIGMLVTEAFPGIENDPFNWIETFGEVAKTGKEIRFQQFLESNDRWYDCVSYQYKPDHFVAAFLDITDQKHAEIELQKAKLSLDKKIITLTKPLDRVDNINFTDLFNIDDIQKLQDDFAEANGVSAIITTPEGIPITKRGNFTTFCKMVRGTKLGCEKCIKSDAFSVNLNANNSQVRRCKSSGLWEAGAAITIEGKHIANWIIGQVRTKDILDEHIIQFSNEIGIDKKYLLDEFYKVPIMEEKKFKKIANMLFTLATQLSTLAYQNVQQARHIAEEKRVEKLITIERDRAQTYLDTVEAIIVALDDNGLITLINRKGCELFGYSEKNLKGKSWFYMCLPQPYGMEKVYPYYKKLMKGDIINAEYFESEIITASGEIKSIAWHNSVVYNDKGKIVGTLSSGEDITEKKIAEEALKKSENALKRSEELLFQSRKLEAIGKLAGGIAHDFNNILGGIMGGVTMLKKIVPQEEKSDRYMSIISDSVRRASDLTNKLLTFSRNKSSEQVSLDLHKIINESISLLENTLDKRIEIKVFYNADRFFIQGEESQLQSLILNLGINASHAMSLGGILTIITKNIVLDSTFCNLSTFNITPGNYIQIEVHDSGSGIEKKHLPHIFDPFYTTKESGKGTGLGLSVVYGTVQQFNGSITVKSEVGVGSTFYILFPVTDIIPKKIVEKGKIIRGSGTILLIDDEKTMRIVGKDILESFGYTVLLAKNGEEGIKIFRNQKNNIKFILLDMIMPKISGTDCFMELRKIKKDIPIVITSGYTSLKDLELFKKMDYNGFVKKPYTDYDLNSAIRKIFK